MASKKPAPNQELQQIIESAERLGIELNEADALQWLTAISAAQNEDDVVGTAVFLASEDAAFITGQNIVVDGGWALY